MNLYKMLYLKCNYTSSQIKHKYLIIFLIDDTNQGKEKALDEEFGEDSVAVRLIEDYLEGKITSLIDLSQLLKDEAGLVISKSTLARRLKGKVCCFIINY